MTTRIDDIIDRLRVLRATAPRHSATDRVCRDAIVEIENLRSLVAPKRQAVLDAAVTHWADAKWLFPSPCRLCDAVDALFADETT